MRPVREHIPVYLASVGPKNLEVTGEIADGWLSIFFSPEHSTDLLETVRAGARKAGKGTDADPLDGFDVVASVPVVVGDDVEQAARGVRPYAALYIGGMGSRKTNFYNRLARQMGFDAAADEVQDLYLAGRQRDAAAAVPLDFIDETSLLGSRERIAERMHAFAEAGVTTLSPMLSVGSLEERLATLRMLAELHDQERLG